MCQNPTESKSTRLQDPGRGLPANPRAAAARCGSVEICVSQ